VNKIVRRLAGGAFVVAIATAALSTRAAAPAGRYTVTGSTVLDNKTTLTWQLATSAVAFTDAPGYCGNLPNGTWRVPTLKELLTLVDFSTTSPAVDATFKASTPSGTGANTGFWSADEANAVSAWFVDFSTGIWSTDESDFPYNVRCVK
jgi:hypothetical protein